MKELSALTFRASPILAGLSRKSTIGCVTGRDTALVASPGSLAAHLIAAQNGARILRVHDVVNTVDADEVLRAMTNLALAGLSGKNGLNARPIKSFTIGIPGEISEPQIFWNRWLPRTVGRSAHHAGIRLKLGYAAGACWHRKKPMAERGPLSSSADTRISGYMIESALEAGLSAAGVDVLLTGPIPTPGVAYLTRVLALNAGVMISASHNPFDDNGIKFFSADGLEVADEVGVRHRGAAGKPLATLQSINRWARCAASRMPRAAISNSANPLFAPA